MRITQEFEAAVADPQNRGAGSSLAQISSTSLAQISSAVSFVDQAPLPFSYIPCPENCVDAPQNTADSWAILSALIP